MVFNETPTIKGTIMKTLPTIEELHNASPEERAILERRMAKMIFTQAALKVAVTAAALTAAHFIAKKLEEK